MIRLQENNPQNLFNYNLIPLLIKQLWYIIHRRAADANFLRCSWTSVLSYDFHVCDPNGRWYLADSGSVPGDLLLLTGKALNHATAGLRPVASHRSALDIPPGTSSGGRTSLVFRLMPQGDAILDCSPIAAAGHVIPQSYVPIFVTQFMDAITVLVMCQSL
ncbi:unnamed protein product [Coffea canephora]|uniref:Uncharacterized protein n=1 Tax=Coffea canephora TaxID=49390 RepID=A0A068UDE2_COFCA|nr:unnamed protein product [Coffea canephora]